MVKQLSKKAALINFFSNMVEKKVKEDKLSYIEAIIEITDSNNIEIDEVPKLINANIKQSLQLEGENLNLLKKSNRII